jgi:hypothetical protein
MDPCENCGDKRAVTTRTACLAVPERDEQRAESLDLCRDCADAFDLGAGDAPTGHGLPEAGSR